MLEDRSNPKNVCVEHEKGVCVCVLHKDDAWLESMKELNTLLP